MSSPSPQAEIYNTDRFAELYHASRNPALENLGLASRFLIRLFRDQQVPFAFLGGWAVFLRGSQRMTQDVDITVGSTMDCLKAILLQKSRVCIPEIHGATCIQIFLHTGGDWDPQSVNVHVAPISVDIIINGNLGTPPKLPSGSDEITPVPLTTQGREPVPVIDLYHQFSSKLQAHSDRRASFSTNDYIDLQFLVTTYYNEIYSLRHAFDLERRWLFWGDYAARNSSGNAKYFRTVLGLDELDF